MTQNDRPETPPNAIVVDCDLAEPPEKVWRALTEPALVARWLMPNDMRPRVGERFSLRPVPANGNDADAGRDAIHCEVLAVEPNRLLRYSWREAARERDADGRGLDTVVTFLLAETASGGTRLRVIHSGFPQPSRMGGNGRPSERPRRTVLAANANFQPGMRLAARG